MSRERAANSSKSMGRKCTSVKTTAPGRKKNLKHMAIHQLRFAWPEGGVEAGLLSLLKSYENWSIVSKKLEKSKRVYLQNYRDILVKES